MGLTTALRGADPRRSGGSAARHRSDGRRLDRRWPPAPLPRRPRRRAAARPTALPDHAMQRARHPMRLRSVYRVFTVLK